MLDYLNWNYCWMAIHSAAKQTAVNPSAFITLDKVAELAVQYADFDTWGANEYFKINEAKSILRTSFAGFFK